MLADNCGAVQRKADPCLFWTMVDAGVVLILVVHVDGILVGGEKGAYDELRNMGCAGALLGAGFYQIFTFKFR